MRVTTETITTMMAALKTAKSSRAMSAMKTQHLTISHSDTQNEVMAIESLQELMLKAVMTTTPTVKTDVQTLEQSKLPLALNVISQWIRAFDILTEETLLEILLLL